MASSGLLTALGCSNESHRASVPLASGKQARRRAHRGKEAAHEYPFPARSRAGGPRRRCRVRDRGLARHRFASGIANANPRRSTCAGSDTHRCRRSHKDAGSGRASRAADGFAGADAYRRAHGRAHGGPDDSCDGARGRSGIGWSTAGNVADCGNERPRRHDRLGWVRRFSRQCDRARRAQGERCGTARSTVRAADQLARGIHGRCGPADSTVSRGQLPGRRLERRSSRNASLSRRTLLQRQLLARRLQARRFRRPPAIVGTAVRSGCHGDRHDRDRDAETLLNGVLEVRDAQIHFVQTIGGRDEIIVLLVSFTKRPFAMSQSALAAVSRCAHYFTMLPKTSANDSFRAPASLFRSP